MPDFGRQLPRNIEIKQQQKIPLLTRSDIHLIPGLQQDQTNLVHGLSIDRQVLLCPQVEWPREFPPSTACFHQVISSVIYICPREIQFTCIDGGMRLRTYQVIFVTDKVDQLPVPLPVVWKIRKKRLNKCITRPCKFRSKFKCNNVKCNNKPNSFNKDWPWNVIPVLLLFFNGNRNILSVPTYWLNKFKKYFTTSQIKIHVWAHLECL